MNLHGFDHRCTQGCHRSSPLDRADNGPQRSVTMGKEPNATAEHLLRFHSLFIRHEAAVSLNLRGAV